MSQNSLTHFVDKDSYWSDRYQNEDYPWDLGGVTPGFKDWIETHSGNYADIQNVIIPGCGLGHDLELFSEIGSFTLGVDFASNVVEKLNLRYAHYPKIEIVNADIFDLSSLYPSEFDLWVEYTCYPAINPDRRQEYIEVCQRVLSKNGYFLGLIFPLDEKGPTAGPPFGINSQSFEADMQKYFDLVSLKKDPPGPKPRQGREWLYLWRKRD